MSSLLVRLIPYLYYFIKESHRRDMEEEMTPKKRTKYRTLVAVLIAVMVLGSVFAYFRFRKEAEALGLCLVEVQQVKERTLGGSADYVPRTQHDHDVAELSHKNTTLEIYNEILVEKLKDVCTTKADSCDKMTMKVLEKVEKLHINLVDTPAPLPSGPVPTENVKK